MALTGSNAFHIAQVTFAFAIFRDDDDAATNDS